MDGEDVKMLKKGLQMIRASAKLHIICAYKSKSIKKIKTVFRSKENNPWIDWSVCMNHKQKSKETVDKVIDIFNVWFWS